MPGYRYYCKSDDDTLVHLDHLTALVDELQRIYYLHRVQMHVRSKAASGRDGCRFSAPPMSYFLLSS